MFVDLNSLPISSSNNNINNNLILLQSTAPSIQKKHLPDLVLDKVIVSFCIDSWFILNCEGRVVL